MVQARLARVEQATATTAKYVVRHEKTNRFIVEGIPQVSALWKANRDNLLGFATGLGAALRDGLLEALPVLEAPAPEQAAEGEQGVAAAAAAAAAAAEAVAKRNEARDSATKLGVLLKPLMVAEVRPQWKRGEGKYKGKGKGAAEVATAPNGAAAGDPGGDGGPGPAAPAAAAAAADASAADAEMAPVDVGEDMPDSLRISLFPGGWTNEVSDQIRYVLDIELYRVGSSAKVYGDKMRTGLEGDMGSAPGTLRKGKAKGKGEAQQQGAPTHGAVAAAGAPAPAAARGRGGKGAKGKGGKDKGKGKTKRGVPHPAGYHRAAQ